LTGCQGLHRQELHWHGDSGSIGNKQCCGSVAMALMQQLLCINHPKKQTGLEANSRGSINSRHCSAKGDCIAVQWWQY